VLLLLLAQDAMNDDQPEPAASPPPPPAPKRNITAMALAVEGGLGLAAIALGWLVNRPPLESLGFTWPGLGLGLAATLPMALLFWAIVRFPVGPLGNLVRTVDRLVVPLFADCSLVGLAAIAMLAGFGEEMLFRGVIQSAIAAWLPGPQGPWIALAAASVVFGVFHWITPTYAAWGTAIGAYLGWLWIASGNLLVPSIAHGLYDFLALVYLVRVRRGGLGSWDLGLGT
jgi:uncharacterized protein